MRPGDTKPKRPVAPEKLAQLIERADRIVVREFPSADAEILFESKDKADLDALKQCLTVEGSGEWFHCMCIGEPSVHIFSGDEELVQVTNHHGLSIRCSLWDSDARILDVEKWLSWFDDRGIDGPRKEVEETRVREAAQDRNWKKWISAMPEGLRPVWEDSLDGFGDVDTAALRDALKTSVAGKAGQIRALLTWFGSGAGPWSGFPSYESAAEELLLDYEISEIVEAMDIGNLTHEQAEGAARLFGGWNFSRKYPKGTRRIPGDIKRALWNHVKQTEDQDKRARAKRAFRH